MKRGQRTAVEQTECLFSQYTCVCLDQTSYFIDFLDSISFQKKRVSRFFLSWSCSPTFSLFWNQIVFWLKRKHKFNNFTCDPTDGTNQLLKEYNDIYWFVSDLLLDSLYGGDLTAFRPDTFRVSKVNLVIGYSTITD